MGYHQRTILKREYGTLAKLQEEIEEALDAEEQGNSILILCELADIYGAMEGYLAKKFPSITMEDIKIMAKATRSAFEDKSR